MFGQAVLCASVLVGHPYDPANADKKDQVQRIELQVEFTASYGWATKITKTKNVTSPSSMS